MNSVNPSITGILEKIRPLVSTLSPEDRLALIQAIASEDLPASSQDTLLQEQVAWFARSKSDRQRFAGEFVAVQANQVIDHDSDQRALYLRIRTHFTGQPVLIVHADWDEPPAFTIHSPHVKN
jgi:hypothetical protein